MILRIVIDDQIYEVQVPDAILAGARDYFDQLDCDMDGGWRMGREWIVLPDRIQRCQIVADRLLTALETNNVKLGTLMAGYILTRLPGVDTVIPDIQGEPQNTQFEMGYPKLESSAPTLEHGASAGSGFGKLAALEQAGREVTPVFKVGRGYRFSVFDSKTGGWQDSPLIATESEAVRLRQEALKSRYESLVAGGG
ncbi:hypothetical protein GWK36_05055 [Caldichromatium japonicum]|uniref:Uncharacterized protein n=1 Tax=Caldichromatium japonicum TaxID=2699430 RepID=A0A6G7VBR0_9GAMM|nr:hypothetical protein [Caldichromatium japonicum]QIK37451.1 hypothetical protein GWK36_05055 [Caldichromatium japonicum]